MSAAEVTASSVTAVRRFASRPSTHSSILSALEFELRGSPAKADAHPLDPCLERLFVDDVEHGPWPASSATWAIPVPFVPAPTTPMTVRAMSPVLWLVHCLIHDSGDQALARRARPEQNGCPSTPEGDGRQSWASGDRP